MHSGAGLQTGITQQRLPPLVWRDGSRDVLRRGFAGQFHDVTIWNRSGEESDRK
jgi:hypothetical protein